MVNDLLLPPTNEHMRRLKEELQENDDKFKNHLQLFENWIKYQTHLPKNIDKNLLSNFLRSCKVNLEKVQKKFECFCYLPHTYDKLMGNRDVSLSGDLQITEYIYIVPLPQLSPEGYRISVVKILDPDKYEMLPTLRYALMLCDYRCYNEEFIIGDSIVIDMDGMKSHHYIKTFTPLFFHFIKMTTETYPTQVKQVVVLSCHPLLEKGVNLCKSMLSPKIANRVHVVSNPADLGKYIHEKYLPSDYNGCQDSLKNLHEKWTKLVLSNKNFYADIAQLVPASPIPKYLSKYDEGFGLNGSFRKLNID